MAMESDMKAAWVKAGLKLGLGFLIVGAVIGIRVVTATPDGVEADIEEMERATQAAAVQATPAAPKARASEVLAGEGGSLVDRLSASIGAGSAPQAQPGSKMVSCTLGGGTQFMTADDCAMRGGRAKVFEGKP
jgi:hypothetical protein